MRARLPFTQLTNLARMALKLLSYYPGEIPKALSVDKPTQTNEAGKMANSQRTMMVAKTEGSRKCPQVLLRKIENNKPFPQREKRIRSFSCLSLSGCPFSSCFLFIFVPFFCGMRYLPPVAALLFRFYSLTIFRL